MLVGGTVRDEIMNIPCKDYDIEVYGIQPVKLREILDSLGNIDAVGESFAVYKLDNEIDVSIPRRERKSGKGHKGFIIEGDPDMSFEEACSRRDFTMNAIMKDVLTGEIIDPFEGQYAIKNAVLAHVNDETFVEDSLRVLRACQFSARFLMFIDRSTHELCKSIDLSDLPKERIWGELVKILLSPYPDMGLHYLNVLRVNEKLFPEIHVLKGVQQEPEWHPEGDVFIHTEQVVCEARKLIDDLSYPEQITVMLAALCHDFGKASTTKLIDGRWRAKGHEEAGIEPTISFLDKLGIYTIDGFDVREQVIAIVANHLAPVVFYKNPPKIGAFRRLANKVRMDLLCLVSKADVLGRYKDGKPAFTTEAHDWFMEKISKLEIKQRGPDNILMGRHLLELGIKPSKEMGNIIKTIYELQLDGKINNLQEAIEEAKKLI